MCRKGAGLNGMRRRVALPLAESLGRRPAYSSDIVRADVYGITLRKGPVRVRYHHGVVASGYLTVCAIEDEYPEVSSRRAAGYARRRQENWVATVSWESF